MLDFSVNPYQSKHRIVLKLVFANQWNDFYINGFIYRLTWFDKD